MKTKIKSKKYNLPKSTITSLVLKLFKNNPKIKSNEMIEKVKKDFKQSKFKLSHYSWFKYQIKKGKYNLSPKVVNQL